MFIWESRDLCLRESHIELDGSKDYVLASARYEQQNLGNDGAYGSCHWGPSKQDYIFVSSSMAESCDGDLIDQLQENQIKPCCEKLETSVISGDTSSFFIFNYMSKFLFFLMITVYNFLAKHLIAFFLKVHGRKVIDVALDTATSGKLYVPSKICSAMY